MKFAFLITTPTRQASQTTGEYTVETATNLNEITQLMQNGFKYAATIEGIRLLIKRK